ncbi:N-acetyltransferase [Nocardioides seonyuensis]|uniref:N-acetyltransferase n=1 Tax=Nocardioides seonyuensis TaxID=2518371 RepID=A0A4P7IJ70_9ACTN|nr:GNAT family N-acetyltransferase [Nocardioides seonyuensis]QBX56760.1 N-acetyltransferase [Nocardioides seonyuensis]
MSRFSVKLPLVTDRLRIRPFDGERDLLAFHAYRSLPEVCRYAPIEPATRAQISSRLEGDTYTRSELREDGDAWMLAVEETATGEMIGDVILFWRSTAHEQCEVGWTINPAAQGRGYATEAARALAGAAFEHMPVHRLSAVIDERNEASVKVARRLGMRQEARRVDCEWLKGQWVTLTEWAVLEHEWAMLREEHQVAR